MNSLYEHDYVLRDNKLGSNEKKTMIVVFITFVTMIFEIVYGLLTGSMALLADGWHMGSHVGALGISVIVYKMARSKKINEKYTFGAGKLIPLGGYTSALMLGIVAIFMFFESIFRFLNPEAIQFETALYVSIIGLVVNLISAFLLMDHHDHHHSEQDHHEQHCKEHDHHHEHHHEHVHDHNHQSALVHVIADALTSFLAILALLAGKYMGWNWADPLIGILGAIVILKWAYALCKATIWELLDGNSKFINTVDIVKYLEEKTNSKVIDIHVWRIAPNAHAGMITLNSNTFKGSSYYHELITEKFKIEHLTIEERVIK